MFEILESLELKIFFKNNLFSITNNSLKISIDELINKSDDLYRKTLRDYELYSKKFEFDKFKDNLCKEKDRINSKFEKTIDFIKFYKIMLNIIVGISSIYILYNGFQDKLLSFLIS